MSAACWSFALAVNAFVAGGCATLAVDELIAERPWKSLSFWAVVNLACAANAARHLPGVWA